MTKIHPDGIITFNQRRKNAMNKVTALFQLTKKARQLGLEPADCIIQEFHDAEGDFFLRLDAPGRRPERVYFDPTEKPTFFSLSLTR
ncbi:MAG: hypothetical protein HY982_01790 [Candidatus Magasanikbacteria bacterium]|nr:hypothetical protein [Candidatus Magasanikbacteria bacterium]